MWTVSVGGAGTGTCGCFSAAFFGVAFMRMWALVGRQCLMPFMGACVRLWGLFCGSCGRTWALVGGSVACVLHECACGAQLTFGCLDVAVISTRVNGVGMFLRRAEPASTLGAWAGLGSGFFFVCFSCVFPWLQVFFLEGRGPPQAKAPHEVCWNSVLESPH